MLGWCHYYNYKDGCQIQSLSVWLSEIADDFLTNAEVVDNLSNTKQWCHNHHSTEATLIKGKHSFRLEQLSKNKQ